MLNPKLNLCKMRVGASSDKSSRIISISRSPISSFWFFYRHLNQVIANQTWLRLMTGRATMSLITENIRVLKMCALDVAWGCLIQILLGAWFSNIWCMQKSLGNFYSPPEQSKGGFKRNQTKSWQNVEAKSVKTTIMTKFCKKGLWSTICCDNFEPL